MFYVKAQNATIVARHRGTGVIFECFEVSPKTDAVLEAQDALVRSFPARAVFLSQEIMKTQPFVQELGTAVHKLSIEQLSEAMKTTEKGGNTVSEDRQSPSPRFVTEWLFGAVLSFYGKATSNKPFTKRTHDDVVWKDTDKPWRRSGVWLSVRVTLQLALRSSDLDDEDSLYYKNLMLFFLARLSTSITSATTPPDMLHVIRAKLARRNAKLGQRTFGFVQNCVNTVLAEINVAMATRWHEVVEREKKIIPSVPVKQAHDELTLRNSREHLHMVWDRSQKGFAYSISPFKPPISTRVSLSPCSLPTPSFFADAKDALTTLCMFENWVEMNLESWLAVRTHSSSACFDLHSTMGAYHRLATTKYNKHPIRLSHMLLTIFELWVALDIVSTTYIHYSSNIHPKYPPMCLRIFCLRRSRRVSVSLVLNDT